jgi:hypothetical protein
MRKVMSRKGEGLRRSEIIYAHVLFVIARRLQVQVSGLNVPFVDRRRFEGTLIATPQQNKGF